MSTRQTNTSANAKALVALNSPTGVSIVDDADNLTKTTSSVKGKKEKIYFTFILKGNSPDENISGRDEAASFLRDHKDIIDTVRSYSNLKFWNNFKDKRQAQWKQALAKVSDTTPEKPSAGNVAKLMMEKLSANRGVDHFLGSYRTTGRATKFVLFFNLVSRQGDDSWCWKPLLMLPILNSYFQVLPCENSTLNKALTNLQYGARPDENDKTKGKFIVYSPSSSGGRKYDIPILTSYAFFDFPVKGFGSLLEEDKWIHTTCLQFFDEIRKAMKTEDFKDTVINLNGGYGSKLYDKSKITNLPKFLADATVKVVKINDITPHVITDVVNIISDKLFEGRTPQPKYVTSPVPSGTSPTINDMLDLTNSDDESFPGDAA